MSGFQHVVAIYWELALARGYRALLRAAGAALRPGERRMFSKPVLSLGYRGFLVPTIRMGPHGMVCAAVQIPEWMSLSMRGYRTEQIVWWASAAQFISCGKKLPQIILVRYFPVGSSIKP